MMVLVRKVRDYSTSSSDVLKNALDISVIKNGRKRISSDRVRASHTCICTYVHMNAIVYPFIEIVSSRAHVLNIFYYNEVLNIMSVMNNIYT